MNYFKDKATQVVFAYDDEQLAQAERLTELELLIQETEPTYLLADEKLQQTQFILDGLIASISDDLSENQSIELNKQIEVAKIDVERALDEFNIANEKYQPVKAEYDAVLPVFYDIRDNVNSMKKMTPKEVDAHLNPPISKEQLIAEAEQQKQLLLADVSNAIAPLQDAVDLDIATDEEMAQLTALKKYRVLLNRIDTSTAPDIEWPEKPL
ncbi:tail fiber assembly protein [Providencia rettgeri]|uniref:tail fiber assembly protein n=1 Tax=Providencia rettgeri TaxID=587 RepID=UPI0015E89F1A|nr:tail fiber assembly protein [Providencia rettgeri]